jgi:hypothetical protein
MEFSALSVLLSRLNNGNNSVLRTDKRCYACIVSSAEARGNEGFAVDLSR